MAARRLIELDIRTLPAICVGFSVTRDRALIQRIADAAGAAIRTPIKMASLSPGGLFAWIESESDIARIRVESQGKLNYSGLLGGQNSLDFGYEGSRALRLRWYKERLVVVSRERADFIRSIDPFTGRETGFYLNRDWLIDNDLLLWRATN